MLPSEFLREFGSITVRASGGTDFGAGETYRLNPNEHRYLLVLDVVIGPIALWWDSQADTTTPIHKQMQTGDNITISHALYGAWANIGFTLEGIGATNRVVILEGFQTFAQLNTRKASPNGTTLSEQRGSDGGHGKQTRSRRKH